MRIIVRLCHQVCLVAIIAIVEYDIVEDNYIYFRLGGLPLMTEVSGTDLAVSERG